MDLVAVFDANILFSAIGWGGVPESCLLYASNGIIVGLTCHHIMSELYEKLQTKLKYSATEAIETIANLATFLDDTPVVGTISGSADPNDDPVLECAVTGRATHIVTGDKKHLLPLGNFQGIPIVTPSEFLRIVEQSQGGQKA